MHCFANEQPIKDQNQQIIGYEKLKIPDKKKSKLAGKPVFKLLATTFIAVHMKHKPSKHEFLYIVTHLKSEKSGFGETMRRAQIGALFEVGPYRADGIFKPAPLIKNPNNLPILICCDLNAKSHDTMQIVDGKPEFGYGYDAYKTIVQKHKFRSLYAQIPKFKGKEPNYTTWKERKDGRAKHTIDYIFEKGGKFDITHYLSIPDISDDEDDDDSGDDSDSNGNDKGNNGGGTQKALLPDWHYPSDHFSLALKLKWRD